MPRDDASVMGRLGKKLVVPKPDAAVEQLRRSLQECRMPQDVVEPGLDPPRAQRMKQNRPGDTRLVRVKFVEQVMAGMAGIHQPREFFPQRFNLRVVEDTNAGQVAVLVEEGDL